MRPSAFVYGMNFNGGPRSAETKSFPVAPRARFYMYVRHPVIFTPQGLFSPARESANTDLGGGERSLPFQVM